MLFSLREFEAVDNDPSLNLQFSFILKPLIYFLIEYMKA